jgi:glucose-6-phosphate dehydrogenase assembly protein OpcA
MTAEALSPERILHDLAELWTATGREGEAGVLRACAMTLIVVSEDVPEQPDLAETIAALMPEHPARAILIRVAPGAGRALSGRVFAQCWPTFGQRKQICCEHIEIAASEASLEDLPAALLPLLAPDLPVVVWWRIPRLVGAAPFRGLVALADKLVLDSQRRPEAASALARIAGMVHGGIPLGDLSWTLTTRWRAMLSRVFDNREALSRLQEVAELRLGFAGSLPPVNALYMAAWVMDSLADAGVEAKLNLAPDPALAAPSIRLEMTGGDFHVVLERRHDRISIQAGALSHWASLAQPTDCMLMREELGILRRDPIFERALASAARLAADYRP